MTITSSDILFPQYPEDTRFLPVSSLFSEKRTFSRSAIKSLAESIRTYGFAEPLYCDNNSNIIDGAKRLEAAEILNLTDVPVSFSKPAQSFSDKLIESAKNEQDFFKAADILLFVANILCVSRDTIASELSLGVSAVSNKMRLAAFTEDERRIFLTYSLYERHARALLKLSGTNRIFAIRHVGDNKLNVAQTDEYVDSLVGKSTTAYSIKTFEKNLCKLSDEAAEHMLENSIFRRETDDEIVITVRIRK